MKSIIYFCIIFLIVMSVYYTSFSKDEKIQLTIFTNDELNNFADNASKFVNDVTDKGVSIAKDGYNVVVAKFQNDNNSKEVSNTVAVVDNRSKSAGGSKPATDNSSKVNATTVADNDTILNAIDSVIESISDNISKTVIMFGEYINENFLNKDNKSGNDNRTVSKDNSSKNEDNSTAK